MLGTSERVAPRPPPTSNVVVLDKQLELGDVEVNATIMSRDDLITWSKKLRENAHRVKSLRILCVPRGTLWSEYHFGQLQQYGNGQLIYLGPEHKMGVRIASANTQHHLVRMAFCKALCAVLRRSSVEELVLGLRLSESGCTMVSEALAANTSLKRLSFAGSHMGDERVAWLKPGLIANNSVEELDLTACNLTDVAARDVAAVIKAHVDRRLALAFDEQLRQYPNTSLPPHRAHLEHHAQLRVIARQVDQACGGLLHLELAENKLTDHAVRALCTALAYDRRLIFLSLRANRLTAAAEAEIMPLMKEHQALLRVDLRQNTDPQLGILKLKRRVAPRVFSAALGFQPNPSAPPPLSPVGTETSMPLWALREEMHNSLGPTPLATPRQSHQAPNSPSRMSMVSWGDMHLLARGAAAAVGAGGSRRSRSNGAGGTKAGSSGKAPALPLQRGGSVGRRSSGDGGGSERDGVAAGVLKEPPLPKVRRGSPPPPPPLPTKKGFASSNRLEQLWADREATLSGEPAAVMVGPGAAEVHDMPQPRATGGGTAGGGDSGVRLQASESDGAAAAAAATATAAAATLMANIPLPLCSFDSFGLEVTNGSGAMSPTTRTEPFRSPPMPSFGLGPVPGEAAISPSQQQQQQQQGQAVQRHGLGQHPLSRVGGGAAAPAAAGAGGVAWVWGRPVNLDGSDMVILSAAAATPPRPQPTPSAVAAPPLDLPPQYARPPRLQPGFAGSGGGGCTGPWGMQGAQPPPPPPRTGWVSLPDGSGVAWLAVPVPVSGLQAPPALLGVAPPRTSSPSQGLQPPPPLPQQQQHYGAATASMTHGSVLPLNGYNSRAGAGGGGGGGAVLAPAGALAAATDSQRQAAFMSMLHREGLAAGNGDYDYLFSKQKQKQKPQKKRRRRSGSRRRGSPVAATPGGGDSFRKLLCGSRQPKSTVMRAGLKRRQPTSSYVTPKASSRTPGGHIRIRNKTTTTTRGRSHSPSRPRSRSRSRTSSSPLRATPTRHYVRSGGGGGGGGSCKKKKSRRTPRPGRNSVGGGAVKSASSSRRGRRVRAKRTRGAGGSARKDGTRRKALRGLQSAAPGSSGPPEGLIELERSLMRMEADVTALEAAAAAATAAVERDAAQRAAAVFAGRGAALAAARAAAAAEAAQCFASEAVDRAEVAERRAKDAVRRLDDAVRQRSPSPPGRRDGATQTTRPPPLVVQLQQQQHPSVQPYEGTARGSGVNVNTIIQQLNRWCGLCDHALLQPPPPAAPQQQPRRPQRTQQPQQQVQPAQPTQSTTILQAKLRPQPQPLSHSKSRPQAGPHTTTAAAAAVAAAAAADAADAAADAAVAAAVATATAAHVPPPPSVPNKLQHPPPPPLSLPPQTQQPQQQQQQRLQQSQSVKAKVQPVSTSIRSPRRG